LARLPAITKSPTFTRPVWAEVSGPRLLANWEKLRFAAGGDADLIAVVKADAYGHGVEQCAPLLVNAGAAWLGVTGAEEGALVRAVCTEAGMSPRILLMSGIFPGEEGLVIDQNLTAVVWEAWQLDLLEAAAAARGLPPGSVAVHLEIDTGMARQGVRLDGTTLSGEAVALLNRFHPGSSLRLEGVMTHFCAPENISSFHPNPQLARFAEALQIILSRGLRPLWLHAGNSSSLIAGPDRQHLLAMAANAGVRLMLRPGLGLYGYLDRLTQDNISWDGETPDLLPVLSWKTRLTSLSTLQVGESTGYGRTFTAERVTRLALLPVGYADGLNRLLSNRGYVLIREQKAPIAGRVSMDQTVVDVTDIPGAAIGDEAVLLGDQGNVSVTAWDLADLTGTIPWEVLCAIGARVPRLMVENPLHL
jgi:alanine racemase